MAKQQKQPDLESMRERCRDCDSIIYSPWKSDHDDNIVVRRTMQFINVCNKCMTDDDLANNKDLWIKSCDKLNIYFKESWYTRQKTSYDQSKKTISDENND